MSQIIRDDLHMKTYHWSVGHRLDARLKKSGMKEQRGFFSGMQLMAMKTFSSQTKTYLLWRRNLTSSVTKSMATHLLKLRSGLHGSSAAGASCSIRNGGVYRPSICVERELNREKGLPRGCSGRCCGNFEQYSL